MSQKEFNYNPTIKLDELTDENIREISDTVARSLAEAAKRKPGAGGGVFVNLHLRIGRPPKKAE